MRRAECGDKDVRRSYIAGQRIDHRNRVAGKIHEQLLARHVRLAHRRRHAAAPLSVELAEPRSMLCNTYLALCCAGFYVAQPG